MKSKGGSKVHTPFKVGRPFTLRYNNDHENNHGLLAL